MYVVGRFVLVIPCFAESYQTFISMYLDPGRFRVLIA